MFKLDVIKLLDVYKLMINQSGLKMMFVYVWYSLDDGNFILDYMCISV